MAEASSLSLALVATQNIWAARALVIEDVPVRVAECCSQSRIEVAQLEARRCYSQPTKWKQAEHEYRPDQDSWTREACLASLKRTMMPAWPRLPAWREPQTRANPSEKYEIQQGFDWPQVRIEAPLKPTKQGRAELVDCYDKSTRNATKLVRQIQPSTFD